MDKNILDYGSCCDEQVRQMTEQIEELRQEVSREKKLHCRTRLQLLQAQVNPHFLYNTLDAVVWLLEAGKQQDAVEMLEQMSVFFRTALSEGRDIIPLKEEIQHTGSYLKIQKTRCRDELEYEILLPEELKEIQIPKLTIQPLVENALYHGIKGKRGKGRIRIVCQTRGEDVRITVEDDGIGMKPERQAEVKAALETGKSESFGLAVVRERIKLYFGNEYGVRLFSKYGEGTQAEICIAKHIMVQ